MTSASRNPLDDAPQHGPRPLPLFLAMLRSETAASPARRAAALAGLARYQAAPRSPACPVAPEIHQAGRARLRDLGGSGPTVVFVPSLINPPAILDLPGNSLVRWIATQGFRATIVDWGAPTPDERASDITAHVETMLVPLLAALETPPLVVGYCLGGTIALAAAALLPLAGLANIAAPWRFAGYDAIARDRVASLWAHARPACDALGLVPMEVLQAGFWQLDPARTISKFERFAEMPPGPAADAFVTLEDWANAGAPLTFAAGRELFEDFYAADRPGTGAWRVGNRAVTLDQLRCRAIEFVAHDDRIVPAAAAAGLSARHDVAAGHVGMIVGHRARAELWTPLADWLRSAASPT